MYIHSRRVRTLWIVALTVAFTIGITNVAAARVFRCASGDVFCLIGSIRSANERPGFHRIILEAGTYTLTVIDNTAGFGDNGLPSVTGRLTIEGAGATETIIQTAEPDFFLRFFRLFHIAATGELRLSRLTIRGGGGTPDGGAIMNEGTLIIADSRIVDNFALIGGGIWSSGSLHILRSTIEHNTADISAGIRASGATTIEDSTISMNDAAQGGGGLSVFGTAMIMNTTIANNLVTELGAGGGLLARGSGLSVSGTVRLINVTIADNFVEAAPPDGGGGIAAAEGSIVLLLNTIVARNTSVEALSGFNNPGPGPGPDCFGSIISLGNNIIADTTDCGIDLLASDHVGDAGLGEFVDDGTPGGGHIPLLPDSPAIDAGNRRACPKRDQLQQRRLDGDGDYRRFCDIGAVEFIPDTAKDRPMGSPGRVHHKKNGR